MGTEGLVRSLFCNEVTSPISARPRTMKRQPDYHSRAEAVACSYVA